MSTISATKNFSISASMNPAKSNSTTAQKPISSPKAGKIVDSGFTSPAVQVSVVSNDGKRVEKVVIAKSGDTYVAKRDNEPALYQLDPSSVTDLQKLAVEVKPAPAPAPTKK